MYGVSKAEITQDREEELSRGLRRRVKSVVFEYNGIENLTLLGARSAVATVKIFGFNERTSVLSIY